MKPSNGSACIFISSVTVWPSDTPTVSGRISTCSAVTPVIWKLSPDRVYWLSASRLAATKEERMTVRTRPSKGITICIFFPPS